jgi:hypothetical protein
MADEKNIALNLVIKGEQGFQSVKELRQYLKELNAAMLQMGDTSSQEFAQLARAAANARDQIDGINENIRAFDPDNRFAGLAQGAQGIANGIQLATSAMALFGAESEDVQKIMMRVQAAMAFSQAISQIGQMKGAFEAFNTAVRANPILGVVAAIIALATAAIGLYEAFKKDSEALQSVNKELERAKKLNEELAPEYERQAKLAEAQGKSMQEVNDIRRKGIDVQLAEINASIKVQEVKLREIKTNDSLWESTQRLLGAALRYIGQAAQANLIELAILQNKKERAAEEEKTLTELNEKKKDLINEIAILAANENKEAEKRGEEYNAKQKALREKDIAERRKYAGERVKAEQALNDEVAKLQDERFLANSKNELDRIAREEEIAVADFKRRNKGLEDEEAYYEGLRRLQDKYGRMKLLEQQRLADESMAQMEAILAEETAKQDAFFAERAAAEIATEKAIADSKAMLRQSSFALLNAIADMELGKDKANQKAKKAIALVDLAIDTGKAIASMTREAADAAAKAQAITPVPGAGAIFYAGYYLARLATIAKNIGQAKRILESGNATSVSGDGGGGQTPTVNAPQSFTPVVPPTTTLTSGLNTNTQQQQSTQSSSIAPPAMRAYVLERDITNTQSNVSIYEQNATFTG